MGIIKPILGIVEKAAPSIVEAGEKVLAKDAKAASKAMTNVFEHSSSAVSKAENAVKNASEEVSKLAPKAETVVKKAVTKTEYQIQKETEKQIDEILSKYVKDTPEYREYYQKRYDSMLKSNGGEPLDAEDLEYLERMSMRRYINRYADDIKIPESEEKVIKDYVEKYKEYCYTSDDYSALDNYNSIRDNLYSLRSRCESDVRWAIHANLNNNGLSQHEKAIYKKFEENEFAKCSNKQLNEIHRQICDYKPSGDELVRFLQSDFSEMANRDMQDVFELLGGLKNAKQAADRTEILRWCSPQDYARRKANLIARREDIVNAERNWQTILNMSDDDYKIYTQIKDSLPKSYKIKDIKQLSKAIEQNPEFAQMIIQKGYKEKDFSKLLELEKDNKELVRRLVQEERKRFSLMGEQYAYEVDEIETICDIKKTAPELIDNLMKENRTFLYIAKLGESAKINKELTNELLSLKKEDYSGKIVNMFNEYEIQDIVKFSQKDSELVDILIHTKQSNGHERWSEYDITRIISRAQKNDYKDLNLIKRLLKEKNRGDYRFNSYDLDKILKQYDNNPELVEKMLTAKNGENFKYDSTDIENLIPLYEQDAQLTTKILEMQNGRFNSNEIKLLFARFKEDEILTNKLLEMDYNRFRGYDVDVLFPCYKESEKLADKLIHAKNYNNTEFRFSASDVKKIFESLKKDKDLTVSMLRKTSKDACGYTIYTYSPKTIALMVSAKEKGEEKLLNILINKTYKDNKNQVRQLVDDVSMKTLLQTRLNGKEEEKAAIEKLLSNENGHKFISTYRETNTQYYQDDKFLNQMSQYIDDNTIDLKIDKGYIEGTDTLTTSGEKGKKVITFFKDKNGDYKILKNETIGYGKDFSKVNESSADKVFTAQKVNGEVIEKHDWWTGKLEKHNIGHKQISSRVDIKDKSVVTEIIEPSKVQKGEYDIVEYSHKGGKNIKKEFLSSSQNIGKTSKGIKTVKKFTSPSGVETNVTRIQGTNGYVMNYEIKDKDGKILGKINRHFTQINDHHYRSTLNGQKYDIIYNGDDIYVTKLGQNGAESETIKMSSDMLNPELRKLYKQLPGDYFFKIKQSGLDRITADKHIIDNACFSHLDNNIQMGQGLENNAFVFSHELGHVLDLKTLKGLNTDPELMAIYKREMEAYKKATTNTEGLSIDYFTQRVELPKAGPSAITASAKGTVKMPEEDMANYNHGIGEAIAEAHALLSGHINNTFDKLGMRSIVLQRNFPETIAYIMGKIV